MVVPELGDKRMFLECSLYDAALHALAATVNEADFDQSGAVRGVDV